MTNGGTEKYNNFSNEAWQKHCDKHSQTYGLGGTRKEREVADFELFCGIFDAGNPEFAIFVYWFFRIFGHPIWPHQFRWGNNYTWFASNTYKKSELRALIFNMENMNKTLARALNKFLKKTIEEVWGK